MHTKENLPEAPPESNAKSPPLPIGGQMPFSSPQVLNETFYKQVMPLWKQGPGPWKQGPG